MNNSSNDHHLKADLDCGVNRRTFSAGDRAHSPRWKKMPMTFINVAPVDSSSQPPPTVDVNTDGVLFQQTLDELNQAFNILSDELQRKPFDKPNSFSSPISKEQLTVEEITAEEEDKNPPPRFMKIEFAYEPAAEDNDDELTLQAGDILELVSQRRQCDDG